MFSLYATASKRLAAAGRCAAILTLSEHMRAEFLRQGFPAERVVTVPYGPTASREHAPAAHEPGAPLHLVVIARLERVKGVHVAIDAAADLVDRLDRSVTLTVIGDGRERNALTERANERCRLTTRLTIEFAGWLGPEARDRVLAHASLLLVPSIWSEPFGLVGLEAGRLGIPAVAFDLGGVRQWLEDGVNGRLAPASPPTAASLALAAAHCLADETRYAAMRSAAVGLSSRCTLEAHIDGLLSLMTRLTSDPMVSACASA
jgi:glycosyltransferase involved in cell wall biosynthesis